MHNLVFKMATKANKPKFRFGLFLFSILFILNPKILVESTHSIHENAAISYEIISQDKYLLGNITMVDIRLNSSVTTINLINQKLNDSGYFADMDFRNSDNDSLYQVNTKNLTNYIHWNYSDIDAWDTFIHVQNQKFNWTNKPTYINDKINGELYVIFNISEIFVEIFKIDTFEKLTTEIIWHNRSLFLNSNINLDTNDFLDGTVRFRILNQVRTFNDNRSSEIDIRIILSLIYYFSLIVLSMIFIIFKSRSQIKFYLKSFGQLIFDE